MNSVQLSLLVVVVCCLLVVNAWPWPKEYYERRGYAEGNSGQPARPSYETLICMRDAMMQCSASAIAPYMFLEPNDIRQKILDTPLSQTCAPFLTARNCFLQTLSTSCGITDISKLPEGREINLASELLDYVCVQEVTVFDENKVCLLSMGDVPANGATPEASPQCRQYQTQVPTSSRCPPQALLNCEVEVLRNRCGTPITQRMVYIVNKVLGAAGCSTGKKRETPGWDMLKRALFE